MNGRVTGIYVKFSFRLTVAVRERLSVFTLFTLRPPGLCSDGTHFRTALFTASVSESFCGVSLGCSGAAVRFDILAEALLFAFVVFPFEEPVFRFFFEPRPDEFLEFLEEPALADFDLEALFVVDDLEALDFLEEDFGLDAFAV